MNKIWIKPQPVNRLSQKIQTQIGLSPIVADILVQRGLRTKEQVVDFLRPSLLRLSPPWAFRNMEKAVERLTLALKHQERVLIYGDYDVDGVSSTAMLYKVLTDLNFKAVAYIPNRMDEGYGLHKDAIDKAYQSDVKVIITVDCGITAVDEVNYAKTLGIDMILTDHHEPSAILPGALAILNPKVATSGYPFRELAGVGVAFKLAQALLERMADRQVKEQDVITEAEILDLVALGTIADLVPLTGENRIMVSSGLKQMEQTVHLGLQALLEECGLGNKPVKAGQIAFLVAPRINAAGRMDSAKAGLELLLTGKPERARELARFLSKENAERQETEKEILEEAIAQIEGNPLPRVIVLSAPNWHHGVIGIVASRLVERYYRPVFLMTEEGEEAKGSARGIQGYHVLNALREQADLLERFGGHRMAAGFSLKKSNIPLLRQRLNEAALNYPEDLWLEHVKVDQLVSLDRVDVNLLTEIEQLAPFGFGNPSPVLGGIQYPLYQVDAVGKERSHLKCHFGSLGQWEGIAFRKGAELDRFAEVKAVDVIFGLDWNTYRGPEGIQLILKDVQPQARWQDEIIHEENPVPKAERALQEMRQGLEEAAAVREPMTQCFDWRLYTREEWLHVLQDKIGMAQEKWREVFVWDGIHCDGKFSSLEAFLELPNGKQPYDEGKDQRWRFGLIIGVPSDWEEWNQIRDEFSKRGIGLWAVAESRLGPEGLARRAGYLSREALIQTYRVLADRAKQANPFVWRPESYGGRDAREALAIFEELGLIRVLGGTNCVMLEWIPAKQKLDLDFSLRYRTAYQNWVRLRKFSQEFIETPWSKLII